MQKHAMKDKAVNAQKPYTADKQIGSMIDMTVTFWKSFDSIIEGQQKPLCTLDYKHVTFIQRMYINGLTLNNQFM